MGLPKPVNPVAEDAQYVDFKEIISKWDYVTAGTVLVEKNPLKEERRVKL